MPRKAGAQARAERPRIAILGAGGIGSFYGGLLARAGADVVFIARGPHLAALRAHGLTVLRDDETFTVQPVTATDDTAFVGAVALVLLATKAYDLDAALDTVQPLLDRETLVLPLLNGVDIVERVSARVPAVQVLAGLTYLPANRPRPGAVHQPGPQRRLILGEARGPASDRCHRIVQWLRDAGIRAEANDDMPAQIWTKFMLVTANGGVCGVTGSPIGAVLAHPDTRALYRDCCREVGAVAAACGVRLAPDAVEATLAHADSTPPHNRPSLLQDLEAGRRLELDALHGTVVRLGRARGVPVPVNTFIHAALKLRAAGRPG